MRPSKALQGKEELVKKIVEAHGYLNPRIFGSTARGEDTENSDLDIIVTPSHRRLNMLRLGGLQFALQELLGVDVDLKTPKLLPRNAASKIEEEAVLI